MGKFNDGRNDSALTYTLSDFVSMKNSDDATYRNFSILEVVNNIELVDHNLIDDYILEYENICVPCHLSLEEAKKYKYSPDLLAYDIYGSVQLDFLILLANDMVDPKEFDLRIVKLPFASKLVDFLNRVYGANQNYIRQNRADNGLIVI